MSMSRISNNRKIRSLLLSSSYQINNKSKRMSLLLLVLVQLALFTIVVTGSSRWGSSSSRSRIPSTVPTHARIGRSNRRFLGIRRDRNVCRLVPLPTRCCSSSRSSAASGCDWSCCCDPWGVAIRGGGSDDDSVDSDTSSDSDDSSYLNKNRDDRIDNVGTNDTADYSNDNNEEYDSTIISNDKTDDDATISFVSSIPDNLTSNTTLITDNEEDGIGEVSTNAFMNTTTSSTSTTSIGAGTTISTTETISMVGSMQFEHAIKQDDDNYDTDDDVDDKDNRQRRVDGTWQRRQQQPQQQQQQQGSLEDSRQIRSIGKALHDNGQYYDAAVQFAKAANVLFPLLQSQREHHRSEYDDDDTTTTNVVTNDDHDESSNNNMATSNTDNLDTDFLSIIVEEYSTCKLHEALCYLKCNNNDATMNESNYSNHTINACSDIIDGIKVTCGANIDILVPIPLRARAHLRRSKAILGLLKHRRYQQQQQQQQDNATTHDGIENDTKNIPSQNIKNRNDDDDDDYDDIMIWSNENHNNSNDNNELISNAIQDAKAAAYLGDKKAVVLYGKLIRASSLKSSTPSISSSSFFGGAPSLSSMFSSPTASKPSAESSSQLFESLLQKSNPFGASGNNEPFSPTSMLLNSLMPGGSGGGGGGGSFPVSSLLNSITGNKDTVAAADGGASLAKSVVSSLYKRIEDVNVQETVCNYIKGASGQQLSFMATMAGITLPAERSNQIVSFCQNNITPKSIRRTLSIGKRTVYVVQIVRKIVQIITKYHTLLILLMIGSWIKSSLLRPLPINKRLVRLATKNAIQEALRIQSHHPAAAVGAAVGATATASAMVGSATKGAAASATTIPPTKTTTQEIPQTILL